MFAPAQAVKLPTPPIVPVTPVVQVPPGAAAEGPSVHVM